MLAEATLTGQPVALFELPRWYDDLPIVKPLVGAVLPLLGGETYRGTPLQQHVPAASVDWLTTRGCSTGRATSTRSTARSRRAASWSGSAPRAGRRPRAPRRSAAGGGACATC